MNFNFYNKLNEEEIRMNVKIVVNKITQRMILENKKHEKFDEKSVEKSAGQKNPKILKRQNAMHFEPKTDTEKENEKIESEKYIEKMKEEIKAKSNEIRKTQKYQENLQFMKSMISFLLEIGAEQSGYQTAFNKDISEYLKFESERCERIGC